MKGIPPSRYRMATHKTFQEKTKEKTTKATFDKNKLAYKLVHVLMDHKLAY